MARAARSVSAGVVVLLAVGCAPSQPAPRTTPVRPTGFAQLDALIAAINTGDSAHVDQMVRAHYAPAAIATPDAHARAITRWLELFALYGPLSVDSVTQASGALVRAWTRGDLTRSWIEFLVFLDSTSTPSRIVRVSVGRGLRPPYADTRRMRGVSDLDTTVRAFVDRLAAADRFSGVVLIAENGREILARQHGHADSARRTRISRNGRFDLASTGKILTSVSVATLARDGKLALSDTIGRWVPELRVGQRITVHQLLQHSSGLGELGPFFDTLHLRRAVDFLPYFRDTALAFAPGSQRQYSNRGYVVAGAVVERAAGMAFGDYLRERIFMPLAMRATGRAEQESAMNVVGMTFYPTIRGGWAPGPRHANTSLLLPASPAGGQYSTVDDMMRLVEALRTNRLGTATLPIFSIRTAEQFGLMVSPDGRWMGHAGAHPGTSTHAWTSPTLGLSFVVLSNYDAASNFVADFIMEAAGSRHAERTRQR